MARPLGIAGAVLGFALITLVTAPLAARAAAPPQLSISVDNGHTSAKSGDRLGFTITVKNLGTAPVKKLTVTQTVPTGLVFGSADAAGTAHAGVVAWSLDLEPGRTADLHTSMTVSATPKDLLRLASVACASSSRHSAPIVCATHSDQLPAGAAAVAARNAPSRAGTSTHGDSGRYYLVVAIGGVVLAAVAGALIIRRRRGHRVAVPTGSAPFTS